MIVSMFVNDCPIQQALINKISKEISIDTVFKSKNILIKKKKSFLYFSKRIIRIPFELPFRSAWEKLKQTYNKQYPNIPINIKCHNIDNINDQLVIDYIKKEKPSLIIVSATTMIKQNIINEAKKINCIILNLHTGVSPYIKGGPNCTNWCLANNFYLIGNTIMQLNVGIDSGAIIATELTNLNGKESLFELHHKVMEDGFNLYVRVVSHYVKCSTSLKVIPQDEITTEGKLFYTKDWTITKVIQAYYNYIFLYKKGIQSFKVEDKIRLLPFPYRNGDR